jgi:hypothetical protein
MNSQEVVIRTTREKLEAAISELERAYIGNERGRLLSLFLNDCERAEEPSPIEVHISAEVDCSTAQEFDRAALALVELAAQFSRSADRAVRP